METTKTHFAKEIVFNESFTNHNKNIRNFELYLVKYDFVLVFDNEFPPHIESDLQ